MKKIVCTMLCIMLLFVLSACGGDVSEVKTHNVESESYSKEDIKAMLAFYESPVGKKMSEKAPAIMEKSQASMMELQGEIQSMMMKYMQ